jgi:hypothetical protein
VIRAVGAYGSDVAQVLYDVANGHFIGEAVVEGCARNGRDSPSCTRPTADSASTGTIPSALHRPIRQHAAGAGGHRTYAVAVLDEIAREADGYIEDSVGRLVAAGFEPPAR